MNATSAFAVLCSAAAVLVLMFLVLAAVKGKFKIAATWLLMGAVYSGLFVLIWACVIDPGLRHLFIENGDATSSLAFKPLLLCAGSAAVLSLVAQVKKTWAHSIGFLLGSWVAMPVWFFASMLVFALGAMPALRY